MRVGLRWDRILTLSLAVALSGCGTASTGAYWAKEDLEKYLPKDQPFSLQCSHAIDPVFFYDGKEPQSEKRHREHHSYGYSQTITENRLITLGYDRNNNILLAAKNGKESLWQVHWTEPFYGGNQITRLGFRPLETQVSPNEPREELKLEVYTEYEGFTPVFQLTRSTPNGEGPHGGYQTVNESFFCMKTSDIDARTNP